MFPKNEKLINLMVSNDNFEEMKSYASSLPSLQIPAHLNSDLEMMAIGAYSPLDRFMGREDFENVISDWRLSTGHLFPVPVHLPVHPFPELRLDQDIAVRSSEYQLLAILTIEEIYRWDWKEIAESIYMTADLSHPYVAEMRTWGPINISGRIQMLNFPHRYDFQELRKGPRETRGLLQELQASRVIAFHPERPRDLVQESFMEIIKSFKDDVLFLNIAAGLSMFGDLDYFNQIKFYQSVADHLSQFTKVFLNLNPLVNRQVGLREILWNAIISRNYGANNLFYSPGSNNSSDVVRGQNSSGMKGHEEILANYLSELGIQVLPYSKNNGKIVHQQPGESSNSWYVVQRKNTLNAKSDLRSKPDSHKMGNHSGSHIDLKTIYQKQFPRLIEGGVCIWFTGLSGSGKSTTAKILSWLLLEQGRKLTLLDGDVVRTHLSKGLGFSKQDRDTNVRRIGFVASEIVRFGGFVLCAVVSPYRQARQDVRNMVGETNFVEVFVDTPLEECEKRDVKGMYAKARSGELTGFTGIDDPYEAPETPEIHLDGINFSPEENAYKILSYLIENGFLHQRGGMQSVHRQIDAREI